MPGFTPEMREKAIAKRKENAALRAKGELPPLTRKRKPRSPEPSLKSTWQWPRSPSRRPRRAARADSLAYDWTNSPLDDALVHLNDLKREYDRASQVILSRTSRLPRIWTCFSTLHKDDRITIMDNGREESVPLIPRSTLAQCRGTVPDGQWKFRADDYRNPETGKLESIVCCGSLCIAAYMSNRPVGGLGRR